MKVKRAPTARGAAPAVPDRARPPRSRPPAARPRRGSGPHARRRGPHLRVPRLRGGTTGGRILASLLAVGLAAALLMLVDGPWLRVSTVAWTGAHYTSDQRIGALLDPLRGTSLLAVDAGAVAERLSALPAVASARVETRFPSGLSVQLAEKAPAFVWTTRAAHLVVAADGTVIGVEPLSGPLPKSLASLPGIVDERGASLAIAAGDRIPADALATALELRAIVPAALGSSARSVGVSIDDVCGYLLRPRPSGTWTAVFGSYELEAGDAQARAARIADQVAAVRTLFANERESSVGWLDARNPGKVYWRPNGRGGEGTC